MRVRQHLPCATFLPLVLIFGSRMAAALETEQTASPAPCALNRADEDYRYVRDPSNRTDCWDPVKYVPLNASGNSYLSLGGEARERYEYSNHSNWGQGPQDDNGYLLQRYLLNAGLSIGRHVRFFSELENGREGGPRSIDKNELDFFQAFLDVKADWGGNGNLVLRSGRQELSYGSQRIISVRKGPNVLRSFDGFRAMYRGRGIQVDAFATQPVETEPYVFDDSTDPSLRLWGVYSVLPLPLVPEGNADLYYIGFCNRHARFDQGNGRETRHSVGTRLWRTAKPLDYNFEFIYQWGSFGDGHIQAWTAASDTGYSFGSLPLRPRLGLKADITSGDKDPNDPDLQTFNPLFPKGAYFGEDGLLGPANHIDLNPSVDLHLGGNVTSSTNCDFFW
jgi:hypothetical protein